MQGTVEARWYWAYNSRGRASSKASRVSLLSAANGRMNRLILKEAVDAWVRIRTVFTRVSFAYYLY